MKPSPNTSAGQTPLIIGHRGYPEVAPENTLPSFARAIEAGADMIELDAQVSRDGVPMLIHDDTLSRTTNARSIWPRRNVRVGDCTAAELGKLDAGSWFGSEFAGTRISTLAETLNFIRKRGSVALVERKSGTPKTYAELLDGEAAGVVLMSFDWKFLREFHELSPAVAIGALGPPSHLVNARKPRGRLRRLNRRWLDDLAATGASLISWNRQVSAPAVQLAHARGLTVLVYTTDNIPVSRRLVKAGVDGVITNRVKRIREALLGGR